MNREEPMSFMKLPHDLVLNCLARVSRMHYQTLSLVSKRFRSLLSAPELYQTRILLGCTEGCLYVSLNKRWFILCLTPNSSKKILVSITSYNSPNTYHSGIASVDSNIYSIGGSVEESSRVMVMDCHSHTWLEAPNMQVAREVPSVCVLDGRKIYVTGGSKNLDESNWIEVFDTKTQTWEFLLSSNSEKICNANYGYRYQSILYDRNVYVQNLRTDVVHKLYEGSWRVGDIADMGMRLRWPLSVCMMGNVLYSCTYPVIAWYDSEVKYWKAVRGLERLFASRSYHAAKLMDYGGNLAICCQENVFVNEFYQERKIWCGEIEIVKRQQGEIWGKLKWFDIVSTTIKQFNAVHVIAVTL